MTKRRALPWVIAGLVAVVLAAAVGVLIGRDDGDDNGPDPAEEERRAISGLIRHEDLPGSSMGSRPEVEFPTYGRCFGAQPLLGLGAVGRTASAQAPGYRLDGTTVGAAVVVAEKAEDTIAAFEALSGSDAFGCIIEAVNVIRNEGPLPFNQTETDEVIREPPVGDQSIAFRTARRGPLRPQNSELVVTILRRGRGMAFLFTWSEGGVVFPEPERVRLASVMAARLRL